MDNVAEITTTYVHLYTRFVIISPSSSWCWCVSTYLDERMVSFISSLATDLRHLNG